MAEEEKRGRRRGRHAGWFKRRRKKKRRNGQCGTMMVWEGKRRYRIHIRKKRKK